jgi:hypothetical protein
MWLTGYKAWFFNRNIDDYKQGFFNHDNPKTLNPSHVFNNALQGRVFQTFDKLFKNLLSLQAKKF